MRIAGIELANCYWADEFDYEPVAQKTYRSVTGALIIKERAQPAGAPMQLAGAWVSRAELLQLNALRRSADAVHRVELDDGREFDVVFERGVRASLVAERLDDGSKTMPQADDMYSVTLHLIIKGEVSGTD